MRAKLATLTALAALIVPSTALGGGFATVGLSPPPDDLGAGTPWNVELEVLQHGRTPLEGVKPRVIVSGNGDREVFPARETKRPGIYRAEVVFPSAGTWRYAVDDGFSQTHTFGPVRIGGGEETTVAASPASSDGGPDVGLALAIAAIAGVVAALGLAVVRRRPTAESG
jgi:hypothetical protein